MIDELDFAGPEHLDPAFVTGYEQKQGNPDPTADLDVLAAHGVGLTSTVVDLGAGTGIFALAAARRFSHVIAVDVSPAMLRVVRERATAAGLENLDCIQAGFLSYQHAGAPVDAVFTRNALHHLPDFWKALALARIAGLLKPGGLFRLWDVVYSFDSTEAPQAVENWMTAVGGASISDEWVRDELEEHVRDEHSTFSWLLEPMITRVGFVIERADSSADRICAKYVCRKPAP
jgi:ubiquinone/menaquinone biosynthesis C-methylase UbiE